MQPLSQHRQHRHLHHPCLSSLPSIWTISASHYADVVTLNFAWTLTDGIFPDNIFQLTEELQCSCVANSSSAGQAAAYSANTECNIECMHSHECSALHFAKGKAPPALQLPTKVIAAQKLGLSSVTVEHIALPVETVHSERDAAAGNYAQCWDGITIPSAGILCRAGISMLTVWSCLT